MSKSVDRQGGVDLWLRWTATPDRTAHAVVRDNIGNLRAYQALALGPDGEIVMIEGWSSLWRAMRPYRRKPQLCALYIASQRLNCNVSELIPHHDGVFDGVSI